MKEKGPVLLHQDGFCGTSFTGKGSEPVTKETIMKAKATKRTKKVAGRKDIVCGNLNNIQEACKELDHTMKVVWTSVGFWACPKP